MKNQATQWGWSEMAARVAAQLGSCHCPPDEHHQYPHVERTMIGGISRLVCIDCGKHRVDSSGR